MNFTRDPIIETIITPKEGYKLIIRNTKGSGAEEYAVDAVEVVSYGQSFFFRSLERPKAFLVPVTDYEVIEVRDTKVMLKTPTMEKSVKIGGGKEAVLGKEKEDVEEEAQKVKKVERRRQRRKRVAEDRKEKKEPPKAEPQQEMKGGGGAEKDETKVSSGTSPLIPPPSGLISDKYRQEKIQEIPEGDLFSNEVEKSAEEEKISLFPQESEPQELPPSINQEKSSEENLEPGFGANNFQGEQEDSEGKVEPISTEPPAPDLFEESTEDKGTTPMFIPGKSSDTDEDEPVF
ncbi:MAG: hypothetical protein Tsb0015_03230 [Simkaniaceae bacterium]